MQSHVMVNEEQVGRGDLGFRHTASKNVCYDHVGSIVRRRTIKFKAHDSSSSVEEEEEVKVESLVLCEMS